jgi:flagellar hook-associated protein 3 FlgL
MEKIRYYNGDVKVPTNESEIQNLLTSDKNVPGTIGKSSFTSEKSEYNRLRLGYDDMTHLDYINFTYKDAEGTTHVYELPFGGSGWKMEKDGVVSTEFNFQKVQTKEYTYKTEAERLANDVDNSPNTPIGNDGKYLEGTIIDRKSGYVENSLKKDVDYTDAFHNTTKYSYQEIPVDHTVADTNFPAKAYVFDNEDDWAKWSSQQITDKTDENYGKKYVPANSMVIIKSTGDLIFGNDVASAMQAKHMDLEVNYDKTGFNNGDLRPEYYYDSVNWTDPQNRTVYNRGYNYYDIKYTIAQNLELTVNLQAWDVFNGDVQQDMKDMTSCVSRAIEAYDKLTKIETLQKDPAYQSAVAQAKLKE